MSELRQKNNSLQRDIGVTQARIFEAERQIKVTQREIDEDLRSSEEARRLLPPRDLAEAVKLRAESRLKKEIESALSAMNAEMTRIFNKIFRKNSIIRIKNDFSVVMREPDVGETEPSKGEAQIIGLAFTAALCFFAKVRKGSQGDLLLPGTEAPLVLDAPFGQLDSMYKKATAEFLPAMAEQIIVMVSSSQGTEDVMEAFKGKVQNEYVLIRHNKGEQGERETESITINGEEINTTIYGSTFDGTEIKEVRPT